jgi:hypothetical protein
MYDDILVDRNIRLSTSIFILVEALKEIETAETLQSAQDFAADALDLYNKVKGMHDGCEKE